MNILRSYAESFNKARRGARGNVPGAGFVVYMSAAVYPKIVPLPPVGGVGKRAAPFSGGRRDIYIPA